MSHKMLKYTPDIVLVFFSHPHLLFICFNLAQSNKTALMFILLLHMPIMTVCVTLRDCMCGCVDSCI